MVSEAGFKPTPTFSIINFSCTKSLKARFLSAECEFENLQDSLINDMIICGTNDNVFCERLLGESDLTLLRAISAGHAAEKTQKHASEILKSQSAANLHKINKLNKPRQQAPNKKSRDN